MRLLEGPHMDPPALGPQWPPSRLWLLGFWPSLDIPSRHCPWGAGSKGPSLFGVPCFPFGAASRLR